MWAFPLETLNCHSRTQTGERDKTGQDSPISNQLGQLGVAIASEELDRIGSHDAYCLMLVADSRLSCDLQV